MQCACPLRPELYGKLVTFKNQIAEVLALLNTDTRTLHPKHRVALERARIAPRKILVADDPGAFVIAVANLDDKLLYWSEIEEGWELKLPNEAGSITSRGNNQYDLSHVLYQALGEPDTEPDQLIGS
jgi:hypothetical protein